MATTKRKTVKRAKKAKPPPLATDEGYTDFQDDVGPRRHSPMILLNGTSVRFPMGWTRAQMKDWRKSRGLLPPRSR
jgi:hypothetical protein